MNVLSSAPSQARPFNGSRKVATAAAKAAIVKSDIQEQLGEKLGGFVWKVEMYPNWLQVSVDVLGNDELDVRAAAKKSEAWAEENKKELQEMFSEVLGEQFPELSIMGRNMGLNNPYGSCCRTGCGGCLNGTKDNLLDKIQDVPTPVDSFR